MGHRVVQLRPSGLNFLQLTQTVRAKGVNIALIAHLSRINTELVVEACPGEPQRTPQREGPKRQPQVEINTQRRALMAFRIFRSNGTGDR